MVRFLKQGHLKAINWLYVVREEDEISEAFQYVGVRQQQGSKVAEVGHKVN